MGVHSSQRRHWKDGDQKERREVHVRSRGAREEKERKRNGEAVKGEGKERKEMKGVRFLCSLDPTPL